MANAEKAKDPNSNRSNQFGTFPMTSNKQWISSWQNYFVNQDATATPVQSPISTVSTSADTLLVVPQGATQLVLYSNQALRVANQSPASAPYFVVPTTTVFTLPCSTPSNEPTSHSGTIYLRADSSAATVQFMFLCV